MEWDVYNMQAERIDRYQLDDDIFAGRINQPVLREAYIAYENNQRQGTASTQKRAEARGGGRKPWPQKGTGRARAGSIRSPLWVGGGVTFGPKPRDFRHPISKKKKRLALISALRLKVKEGRMFLLNELTVEKGKTKEMVSFLAHFARITGVNGKNLVVTGERSDEKLRRASSNIKNLRVIMASNVCGYHVLSHQKVFFTPDSLQAVAKRLKSEQKSL